MALAGILSQNFLNPLGLLALLGLVPLLAFYFFRPEPEEKVMPSMAFFMEDKNSGNLEKAFEKLKRNFLLLLHILVIMGLAAAMANFYTEGAGRPDQAVVVFDRSASMADDMPEAKKFVKSNLGNENTLIVVGEDVEVPLESASSGKVRQYLRKMEARDVETDIAGGLSAARDYRGAIVVASDLDQSLSQRSAPQVLKEMTSGGREVRLMDTSKSNSWGIVGVNPGKANTTVEVKNFMDTRESIRVSVNGESRQKVVGPGETEPVKFSSSHLNRVRLETDSLRADNTAYISVPPGKKFEVMLISDDGNPYLAKALELIGFTSVEQVSPPVGSGLDADVYIVGRTDRLLLETAEKIEKRVENGASLVVFAQPGIEKKFSTVPALGSPVNTSVEILEPRRINVGGTTVHRMNYSGTTLSDPGHALVRKNVGRGELLVYNVRDSDFRFDFLYPVFWKGMMADLTDRPSVQQLNVNTGDTINESWVKTPGDEKKKGEVTATQAGFYNTSGSVYAANLASVEESYTEENSLEPGNTGGSSNRAFRTLIVLLLAGVAAGELVYLRRNGDV
ncbi:MAG: BatA domain-containing protein [Candidatus Nanohaloarchaea archaeon]